MEQPYILFILSGINYLKKKTLIHISYNNINTKHLSKELSFSWFSFLLFIVMEMLTTSQRKLYLNRFSHIILNI